MHRLTLSNANDDVFKELFNLFTADIRWAFDPETHTITADGDLDVILKVVLYTVTRFSFISAISFKVVRIVDSNKDK